MPLKARRQADIISDFVFHFPVWITRELYLLIHNRGMMAHFTHLDPINGYTNATLHLLLGTHCAVACLDSRDDKTTIHNPHYDPDRNFCLLFTDSLVIAEVNRVLSLLQSLDFGCPNPWLGYKFRTNNDRTLLLPKDHPSYGKLEMYMDHV